MPAPGRDGLAGRLRRWLPERLAYRLIRARNILVHLGFHQFCRRSPRLARRVLGRWAERALGADVVIMATGLRLRLFGGVRLTIDGAGVELPSRFLWRGAMLSGVSNFATCLGYSTLPWTLRADLTSRLVCRVLRRLARHGYAAVVPESRGPIAARPLIGLASGYLRRSRR